MHACKSAQHLARESACVQAFKSAGSCAPPEATAPSPARLPPQSTGAPPRPRWRPGRPCSPPAMRQHGNIRQRVSPLKRAQPACPQDLPGLSTVSRSCSHCPHSVPKSLMAECWLPDFWSRSRWHRCLDAAAVRALVFPGMEKLLSAVSLSICHWLWRGSSMRTLSKTSVQRRLHGRCSLRSSLLRPTGMTLYAKRWHTHKHQAWSRAPAAGARRHTADPEAGCMHEHALAQWDAAAPAAALQGYPMADAHSTPPSAPTPTANKRHAPPHPCAPAGARPRWQ